MLSEDRLLGGRVRLRQPREGLRAGHDAVLLAACIPAQPGQIVLELGCGSGAAFLCLMARVPELRVVAVERAPLLAALARENAALNGVADRVQVIEGDIADPGLRRALPRVAHGFANPPYWPAGTAPPEALRRDATHEGEASLMDWASCLGAAVAHGGSASLILPAARFADGLEALRQARFGSLALFPLWPKPGAAAKRVLLAGRAGGKGPARVLPGLTLHGDPRAEAVLRDAMPLDF